MKNSNTSVKRRYKIVKPFRFFVFILICSMITIFAAYAISGLGSADAATLTRYTQVKIQENDTLWSLIETYNVDSNIDIRSALYDVYETNGISADDVKPGDMVLIPIYK